MIDRLVRNEAPSLLDTEKANELIDAINALMNSKGAGGIVVKSDQSGALLIAPKGAEGVSVKYHPFEVISVNEDTIVINPGLVNGLLPSSVSVDNGSGTSYLCLEIQGDAAGITSVDLVREGSPPDGIPWEENGVNTSFKYPIAIVEENSVTSQIVTSNLFFKISIAAEIPKDTILVGEYPNNIYYTWEQTVG